MQFSTILSATLFVISPIYAGSNPSAIVATEAKNVVNVVEGSAAQTAHAAEHLQPVAEHLQPAAEHVHPAAAAAPGSVAADTAATEKVPFYKRPWFGLRGNKNAAAATASGEDHVASPEESAAMEQAVAERKIRNGKIVAGVSGAAVGGIAGGLAGNAWARNHKADKINVMDPNAAPAPSA